MNKHLPSAQLIKPRSRPLRPSTLPTIDRLTGRLFKALLALIGLGLLGTLAILLHRSFD